jgi:hypothetical protein
LKKSKKEWLHIGAKTHGRRLKTLLQAAPKDLRGVRMKRGLGILEIGILAFEPIVPSFHYSKVYYVVASRLMVRRGSP